MNVWVGSNITDLDRIANFQKCAVRLEAIDSYEPISIFINSAYRKLYDNVLQTGPCHLFMTCCQRGQPIPLIDCEVLGLLQRVVNYRVG